MLSPRARSLLALASLLAVARAAPDSAHNHNNLGLGGRCVTVTIPGGVDRAAAAAATAHGNVDPEQQGAQHVRVTYDFEYDGLNPLHRIADHCALIGKADGSNIVREHAAVMVCNNYKHPWVGLSPPEVRVVEVLGEKLVFASCLGREECGPLAFEVQETCRDLVLPPLPRVTLHAA